MIICLLNQLTVKNFRIVFILFVCYSFCNGAVAQTATKILNKCKKNASVCVLVTDNLVAKKDKKEVAITKRRRLKSYQHNPKITRKRKNFQPDMAIAANN